MPNPTEPQNLPRPLRTSLQPQSEYCGGNAPRTPCPMGFLCTCLLCCMLRLEPSLVWLFLRDYPPLKVTLHEQCPVPSSAQLPSMDPRSHKYTHPWGADGPALRFIHVSNALRMAADLHVHFAVTVGSTIAGDHFSNLMLGLRKYNFLLYVSSSSAWFLNSARPTPVFKIMVVENVRAEHHFKIFSHSYVTQTSQYSTIFAPVL